MRQNVSFTNCPECGTPIGSQGLPRHRETQHGVAPEPKAARRKRAPRLSLEERLRRIAE